MISQRQHFIELAQNNYNNDKVIKIDTPLQTQSFEFYGFKVYYFLSNNLKSIYVIFDDKRSFKLPSYVIDKHSNLVTDANEKVVKHTAILANSNNVNSTLVFIEKDFDNCSTSLVVLAQDETYNYATHLTGSFNTTIDKQSGKVIDAEPVQIYFCIEAKFFFKLWNDVQIGNDPYPNVNDSKVLFPGKLELFQNLVFCVIPVSYSSPNIPRYFLPSDLDSAPQASTTYKPSKSYKNFREKREQLYRNANPLKQQIQQLEQQTRNQDIESLSRIAESFGSGGGSDMELEFEAEPEPKQTEQTTKISFDEPLIRLQKRKK